MGNSSDVVTLTLCKPVTADALEALREQTVRALESGSKALLVDIDDVGTLDSSAIRALIVCLREARDHAAVLSLRVSHKGLLETLHITALDRVFPIVTPLPVAAPSVPAKGARRVKSGRFVASIVASLALLGGLAGSRASAAVTQAAAAPALPTPSEAIEHVLARSARIASYQATVGVDVHLRSFPYLSKHLDGTTYFKRPDNFEMVFRSVPSFARGFDRLYSDIDDPTSWERRFDMSLAGEKSVEGHRDVVLRLVQKVRGMIDHEDVAIDPATWRIDAMEWHYYNGGFIAMSQNFEDVGGVSVVATQHATIHIPYVHAAADAVYSDYKTNVAIDDGVFTRGGR
jgi:anti-anti-sigma factor